MFRQAGQSFFTEPCYRQLAGLCKSSQLSTLLLNMDTTIYILYLILQMWLLSVSISPGSHAPVPVDVFTSTPCASCNMCVRCLYCGSLLMFEEQSIA